MEIFKEFNFNFHPDFKTDLTDLIANKTNANFTKNTFNNSTEFIYKHQYPISPGDVYYINRIVRVCFPQYEGKQVYIGKNERKVCSFEVEKELKLNDCQIAISIGEK